MAQNALVIGPGFFFLGGSCGKLFFVFLPCSILPLPLAQAKNGDQQFWKQKYMQRMGRLKHALMEVLGGGVGGRFLLFFLCSQHVPFKFPMGSHQVPNVFLKGVPNSTLL